MPQIWMTYDELAELIGCDAATARAAAIAIPLDRRKSRDGNTRSKLNPTLAKAYIDLVLQRRRDSEIDTCVDNLREAHGQMSALSGTFYLSAPFPGPKIAVAGRDV
jgi:hypothetical protein